MNNLKDMLFGFLTGIVNSLFGAGAGILVVTYLKSKKLPQKSAQATALAVLLPLSAVSAAFYLGSGFLRLTDALPLLPFGIIGTLAGVLLLGKIPDRPLRLLFSLFMLYSGVKMLIG